MHTADDDSIPVPNDAFRVPRGALKWKAPYRTALLLLGGAYAVLVSAGSPTAGLRSEAGVGETLRLPLIAQLALGALGLAALVWVLSRAVREVDKRPYVAIAPVFATFAALVHANLEVDLSLLRTSSAVVAFGVLALALIGGALLVRVDAHAQRLGWGLVIAPWLLLMVALQLAKDEAPFTSSERAYTLGLLFSSLVLGAAGSASRTLRSALTRASASDTENEESSGTSTHVLPMPARVADALAHLRRNVHAVVLQLPRERLRLACTALAATTVVYLGLRALWPDRAPVVRRAPRAAPAATATPVVEQLNVTAAAAAAAPPVDTAEERATATTTPPPGPSQVAPTPTSTKPASTPVASATRKPSPAVRPQPRAPVSPPGLPDWGDLAGFKATGSAPKVQKAGHK